MLFVFNKNRIISYMITTGLVLGLFLFSISIVPKEDIEMVQISSNIANNEIENNIIENENTYN